MALTRCFRIECAPQNIRYAQFMVTGSKLQGLPRQEMQKEKDGHRCCRQKMLVFVPAAMIRLPGRLRGRLVRQH